MIKCEKCLYNANCQFLMTHKKAVVEDCTAFKSSEDFVEVVRCGACKWYEKPGCAILIADDSDKPSENDYCSFGERREDVK